MRKVLLTLSIVCVAFAVMFIGQSFSSSASQILGDKRASVPATYNPAQYGLPERIGGYKVLAVLTSDNTACMMPGEKRLILQADHSNVDDYLKNSDPEAVKKELEQRGLAEMAKWGFQIVGPGANLETILSEHQKWNEQAQKSGCVRFGPPPIITPVR